jgi:hypothetical protein
MILDAMKNEISSSTLERQKESETMNSFQRNEQRRISPTSRLLSSMLVQCILAYDNTAHGLRLTEHLVSKHSLKNNTTAHVLLSILMESRRPFPVANIDEVLEENKTEPNDNYLLKYSCNLILDHIPSSAYLREQIRKFSSRIFSGLKLEWVIPKLIRILAINLQKKQRHHTTNNVSIEDATDAVSACLTGIVESHVLDQGRLDRMIQLMVSTLEQIEVETSQCDDDKSKIATRRISSPFIDRWRRKLFETSFCGNDSAFGNVLVSMAKAMFDSPSSMVPLTLFGSLVGETLPKNVGEDDTTQTCILVAILRLVELCVQQMNADFDSSNAIFGRLAPLLLLRRVPAVYFQIATSQCRSQPSSSASFLSALNSLSDHLVIRLDLEEAVAGVERPSYSAEERRLAAELCGRCLPFGRTVGDDSGPSTSGAFSRICSPAFGAALNALTLNGSDSHSMIRAIKRARVALYVACHHIPIVSESQRLNEDCYRLTASFALAVFRVDADTRDMDAAVTDELVKLQTGCIEFFAICIDKALYDRLPNPRASVTLVSELVPVCSDDEVPSLKGYSSRESLGQICQAVVSILRIGKSYDDWIFSAQNFFSDHLAQEQQFSISARTCLWNAFIVVSQRCPSDDRRLEGFAKSTLSWVVEWGMSGNSDRESHHPLCLAAALQVAFVLVTRTKSLDFLVETKHSGTCKDSARRVHRWALECARGDSRHGDGEYANRMLRLSALKLMLAVFSVDQISANGSDPNKMLGPGDITQTFAVLNSLANMDTDREVQQLAGHLLQAIRSN